MFEGTSLQWRTAGSRELYCIKFISTQKVAEHESRTNPVLTSEKARHITISIVILLVEMYQLKWCYRKDAEGLSTVRSTRHGDLSQLSDSSSFMSTRMSSALDERWKQWNRWQALRDSSTPVKRPLGMHAVAQGLSPRGRDNDCCTLCAKNSTNFFILWYPVRIRFDFSCRNACLRICALGCMLYAYIQHATRYVWYLPLTIIINELLT